MNFLKIKYQVASCLMNIGIIYRRADKSQKALEYY